jgi:monoamine oxidase
MSIQWSKTPYSRGIAGELAFKAPDLYTLMSKPDGPFIFAGEHLSHVGAWQQGAILSGWRAAGQVAERRSASAA